MSQAANSLSATTRDAFLGGAITALQPERGPRAAIDAIFLAAAVPARSGAAERVLEGGTGTGVAALALAARVEDVEVTGVEIQPGLRRLAEENIRINGLRGRVRVAEADVTAKRAALEAAGLMPEGYAHVALNPPFYNAGAARAPADEARARAHVAGNDTLERWVRFAAAFAAPGGTLTVIHRADALAAVLAAMSGRFGRAVVYPLFPRAGEAAGRILVQGVKGSRAGPAVAPGLVLHEAGGAYTAEADAVLRRAAALDLARFAG